MKNIKYLIPGLILAVFMLGCTTEDFTGDSQLTPSSPTLSVDLGAYSGGLVFTEMDSTIALTVTMSEAQIVDVPLYISQIEGTASEGSDFTIDNSNSRVVIPAGRTSGTVVISVYGDDEIEDEETFTIQVGDGKTANSSLTPVTLSFTIANDVSSSLDLDFSWSSADIYTSDGTVLDPTEVADLILSVYDGTGALVGQADGGSFESLTIPDSWPNDTYSVTAGIYGTASLEPGASLPFMDLNLSYFQGGVQSGSFDFAGASNINFVCSENEFHMVDIVKTGGDYTLTKVAGGPLEDVSGIVGAWTGQDTNTQAFGLVGPSSIVTRVQGGVFQLNRINEWWMPNIWGETIQETDWWVDAVIDPIALTITIPKQSIFTTDYNGSLYPYEIYGSGVIDICSGQADIDYELDQEGFLVSEWLYANGYSTDPMFKILVDLP